MIFLYLVMTYSPEIYFRYSDYEVNRKVQGKVNNLISERTDNGGAINIAKCTRVLRSLDSCPGEKVAINMSTMQNSSAVSAICNTREPLWAEDFIDLSEFCQPSTIPTKMEDLVDEHVTSPISSTVRDHGFDYALEVNDGLDNTIEDNLWYMTSPIDMQEELCDPISDWLSATKETNNNDNPAPRSQVYNINDTLLSSTFTSVPKISQFERKFMRSMEDKLTSPPLQPDTTFFNSEPVFNNRNLLNENMYPKSEDSMRLPTTNTLFTEKISEPSYTFQNQFLRKAEVPALNRVTIDTNVSSPCSVQSPSITQSNLNQEEKNGITTRRNIKLKLKMNEPSGSSCSMNTPDMLQPLVNKNSEFDLVSYVFDDNKPSMSFDISNLNASNVRKEVTKHNPINIKTEPKEEPFYNVDDDSKTSKRLYDKDETYIPSKRSRRYSNASSIEDLTQLESEKYRELRNRNNEASRRSRANRKNREVEMRDHAAKLEAENRRLKVKAEEMEQLVKRLRNCLMQLVLKRR